jgi:hypothetical protein
MLLSRRKDQGTVAVTSAVLQCNILWQTESFRYSESDAIVAWHEVPLPRRGYTNSAQGFNPGNGISLVKSPEGAQDGTRRWVVPQRSGVSPVSPLPPKAAIEILKTDIDRRAIGRCPAVISQYRRDAYEANRVFYRMPEWALIPGPFGAQPSRVSGSRTKSMGDQKKSALAVQRSLLESQFADSYPSGITKLQPTYEE